VSLIESTVEIIDRQTGLRDLVNVVEEILAEAGDDRKPRGNCTGPSCPAP